jgi:hypothetical protein
MVILVRVGFLIRCFVCTVLITSLVMLGVNRQADRDVPPSNNRTETVVDAVETR